VTRIVLETAHLNTDTIVYIWYTYDFIYFLLILPFCSDIPIDLYTLTYFQSPHSFTNSCVLPVGTQSTRSRLVFICCDLFRVLQHVMGKWFRTIHGQQVLATLFTFARYSWLAKLGYGYLAMISQLLSLANWRLSSARNRLWLRLKTAKSLSHSNTSGATRVWRKYLLFVQY